MRISFLIILIFTYKIVKDEQDYDI